MYKWFGIPTFLSRESESNEGDNRDSGTGPRNTREGTVDVKQHQHNAVPIDVTALTDSTILVARSSNRNINSGSHHKPKSYTPKRDKTPEHKPLIQKGMSMDSPEEKPNIGLISSSDLPKSGAYFIPNEVPHHHHHPMQMMRRTNTNTEPTPNTEYPYLFDSKRPYLDESIPPNQSLKDILDSVNEENRLIDVEGDVNTSQHIPRPLTSQVSMPSQGAAQMPGSESDRYKKLDETQFGQERYFHKTRNNPFQTENSECCELVTPVCDEVKERYPTEEFPETELSENISESPESVESEYHNFDVTPPTSLTPPDNEEIMATADPGCGPVSLFGVSKKLQSKVNVFREVIEGKKLEVRRVSKEMRSLIERKEEAMIQELNAIWEEVNARMERKKIETQKEILGIEKHKKEK